MTTKIEWCQETWNPLTGCTKISEGCKNCYAERMSRRLAGRYGYPEDEPFKVTAHIDKFRQPNHWKKPRMIFVCSMGDLFHGDVEVDGFAINSILYAAKQSPQHTYLFLTKRPRNMRAAFYNHFNGDQLPENWWVGVTAENQKRADERIPILLTIPAAVRFVSVEPMLGVIDMKNWLKEDVGRNHTMPQEIGWVICGGESGPGARPMHVEWPMVLRDQCVASGVPYFFKQWGEWVPRGPESSGYPIIEGVPRIRLSINGKNDQTDPESEGNALWMQRAGKKLSGRLLDGKEWNQYPTT